MTKLHEYVCSCDTCKNMCKKAPCHGTPEEMLAIMNANPRYMDWLHINKQWDTNMVFIRPVGPYAVDLIGQCPFQTSEGMCELHDKGLKPIEGRVAIHKGGEDGHPRKGIRASLAQSWEKPIGQAVLKEFRNRGGRSLWDCEMEEYRDQS